MTRLTYDHLVTMNAEIESLRYSIGVLGAHRVPTREAETVLLRLRYTPLRVECNICRRCTVALAGLHAWDGQPLVCERCAFASCDVAHCFTPAAVVIELRNGTTVLCERHGRVEAASLRAPARIRHIPDGERRRTLADARASQQRVAS